MEEQTIKLRGIEPKDVDFMLRLVSDPETTRYIQGLITENCTTSLIRVAAA